MNGQVEIDEMYAFIALDPADNTEGIISMQMGSMHMPLVGADMTRVEQLRPHARAIGEATGTQVKLVRFTKIAEEPL